MSGFVLGQNVSLAWLEALAYLEEAGGSLVNLGVVIESPAEEHSELRATLNSFLQASRLQSVDTVANTIFPQSLYRPERGDLARSTLYELFARARSVAARHSANRFGTYFGRLVDWPGSKSGINQLEETIAKLKRELSHRNPKSSIYELGVSTVADPDADPLSRGVNRSVSAGELITRRVVQGAPSASDAGALDLHVYSPGIDNRLMGFPCLSHVSLTLKQGRLHMTAVYRNQFFVQRAYGNYLGLSRLLLFIAREAGCEAGEVLCVATHADAELARISRARLRDLIQQCRSVVAMTGDSTYIEAERTSSHVVPFRV